MNCPFCPVCQKMMKYTNDSLTQYCHYICSNNEHDVCIYDDGIFWTTLYKNGLEHIEAGFQDKPLKYYVRFFHKNNEEYFYPPPFKFKDSFKIIQKYLSLKVFL